MPRVTGAIEPFLTTPTVKFAVATSTRRFSAVILALFFGGKLMGLRLCGIFFEEGAPISGVARRGSRVAI